jgi:hypothetical protein
MTRPEAEALVVEKEGRMCARFYQRADGSALTSDCPVGLRIKRVRVSRRIGFAFSGLLGLAAHAWAQSPMRLPSGLFEAAKQGALSGVVTDVNGAVIVGTTVELRNVATGRTASTRADEYGQFRFSALAAGNYSIKLTSPGFKVSERARITVLAGRTTKLEIGLDVGPANGGVIVEAMPPKR